MPAPADTPLAEAYGDRLELVARTTADAASRTWRPEGLWINTAGAAIRGGQALGIALAREHARLVLERAGTGTELPAEARADALGKLSSGMVLERALAAVAVAIEAAAPDDRPRVARTAIARIAHSATYDASRAELHELVAAGPFDGWRWLSRGTCAACLSRDNGGDKPDGTAMRVHPSCRCVAEPLARDPFESLLTQEGEVLPSGTDWEPLESVEEPVQAFVGSTYTASGRSWNAALRSSDDVMGATDPTSGLMRELQRTAELPLDRPRTVYRGVAVDAETATGLQPGAVISDRGFWSTTPEPWVAEEAVASLEQYEDTFNVLFEIVAKRGTAIANDYREVVLPAGGRYRVVSVKQDVDLGFAGARADTVVQVIQL